MKLFDLLLVVVWTGRGGEVFLMLNSLWFGALSWRIAYRRGWDA